MNKKFTFILLTVLMSYCSFAQRYQQKVFDSVQVVSNIQYGFNYDCVDTPTNLYLDIYKPFGDTAHNRPLIVLAHGGSFIQGSRSSSDMQAICKHLASRGYVVASFDYRLKINFNSGNTIQKEFSQAVWRGVQDGRAAIRYFRKGIATGNALQIDNNNIYTGGVSAGGVLGLQLAFLDTYAEFSQLGLDTSFIGGIEGNSGNPGYSWRVKGVISLCGALSNTAWMNNNKNVTICNMHGTNDNTVPYKTNYFKFAGVNVAFLQGGFSVDSAARKQSMDSRLYTFYGADHVPFVGNALYMDTTLKYVTGYLYNQVTGLIPLAVRETINTNPPSFTLYPNPATSSVTVSLNSAISEPYTVALIDMCGKLLNQYTSADNTIELNTSYLSAGFYFIKVSSERHTAIQRLIIH
ncbi:MAG: T9SS type A sorting domain-containing protein [Bacteroidia bacterium]|nr:T9SS type A sorting domain-containing protein [Bacteroidia bacterium]